MEELDGTNVTAWFLLSTPFEMFYIHGFLLFETPNFCIVTDPRPVHSDILPRLDHLYWTHSRPVCISFLKRMRLAI